MLGAQTANPIHTVRYNSPTIIARARLLLVGTFAQRAVNKGPFLSSCWRWHVCFARAETEPETDVRVV